MTYRLTQALAAIQSGVRAMAEEDGEISTDPAADFPDEAAALEDALRSVVRRMQEAEALERAATAQLEALETRARRFEARALRCRGVILAAMDAMGWAKKELPEATLSVRPGKPGVVITDENAIPSVLMRRLKAAPDKAAIREALERGEVVPGAAMSNGLAVLTIRNT